MEKCQKKEVQNQLEKLLTVSIRETNQCWDPRCIHSVLISGNLSGKLCPNAVLGRWVDSKDDPLFDPAAQHSIQCEQPRGCDGIPHTLEMENTIEFGVAARLCYAHEECNVQADFNVQAGFSITQFHLHRHFKKMKIRPGLYVELIFEIPTFS